MSSLPLPCPFHDLCGGFIELHPELEVTHEHQILHGTDCVTDITLTCELVAECNRCTFIEIVESERRTLTFDQFYCQPASEEPEPPFLAHLAELEAAGQFIPEAPHVE